MRKQEEYWYLPEEFKGRVSCSHCDETIAKCTDEGWETYLRKSVKHELSYGAKEIQAKFPDGTPFYEVIIGWLTRIEGFCPCCNRKHTLYPNTIENYHIVMKRMSKSVRATDHKYCVETTDQLQCKCRQRLASLVKPSEHKRFQASREKVYYTLYDLDTTPLRTYYQGMRYEDFEKLPESRYMMCVQIRTAASPTLFYNRHKDVPLDNPVTPSELEAERDLITCYNSSYASMVLRPSDTISTGRIIPASPTITSHRGNCLNHKCNREHIFSVLYLHEVLERWIERAEKE